MNPHEKLAMEFFSPPGPSAREWRAIALDSGVLMRDAFWVDGALGYWPSWDLTSEYEIRLKPQTITLPERTIPKPLDVGELVIGEDYYLASPAVESWYLDGTWRGPQDYRIGDFAARGLLYPHTDQGKADAIAAAKGMINWRDEG